MKLTEQQWTYDEELAHVLRADPDKAGREQMVADVYMTVEEAHAFGPGMAAAPDMARTIADVLAQAVASHALVLGPSITIDDVAAREHPVMVTPQHLLALIAAARKAKVLP